jgi:phenylacetic acid degradation operon negative regulatory protein
MATRNGVAESTLHPPGEATLASGSARSLLMMILGELVWPTDSPVWTSALVYVLKGLGVEEQTARQAIARAASSDWIVGERRGREVSWSLTPKLTHIFDAGAPRVYSLSDPFSGWDGRWLALFTTIPQSHRSARRPLYAGLTWAGFGNPAPGLWLSPHTERAGEVSGLIEELDLKHHTFAFVGTLDAVGIPESEVVTRGWDLDTLHEHYERVLDAIDELKPKTPDETLFAHIRVLTEWRELTRGDPQLPEALLPDWIGRRVSRRIEVLRAKWTPTVQQRFAELNSPTG